MRRVEYRRLGSSGLRVSAIGLGCNPFGNEVDAADRRGHRRPALDLGVTYFDTADAYFEGRSEEYLGRASPTWQRGEIIVATKFGNRMGPGRTTPAPRASTSCTPARPACAACKPTTSTSTRSTRPTARRRSRRRCGRSNDLVRQGKVRYIGCSNFFEWEVVEAQWVARTRNLTPFVACQDFYNLLYRDIEKRMLPMCVKYGLGMIPYMPLAAAMLSGAYHRGVAPGARHARRDPSELSRIGQGAQLERAGESAAFADARGWALSQMAIAWMLTRPDGPR